MFLIGAIAVMAHGAKTAHQARFAAAAAGFLTAKTVCGTDVKDPLSRITTVAELAKFAGVMIVLKPRRKVLYLRDICAKVFGDPVFAYAAVKVATTYRAEIALKKTSFASSANINSAKSVFRVQVLPVRTATRRCRKDISPTKRTLCMKYVTCGRPVPV